SDQIVIVTVAFAFAVVPLLIRKLARDPRSLDFSSSAAMRRATLLLLALIFLNSVAASLAAVLNELASQFWLPLFAWIAVVLALQLLVVAAALTWIGQSWFQLALMAAISAANFFTLYLSLLGKFLSLSEGFQLAVIAIVLLLMALLFAAVGKRIVPARSVNTILVVTMLGPVAAIAIAASQGPTPDNSLAAFEGIEFGANPNIHIVSIDALSPATLVEKHMGLTDMPYARLLSDDEEVVFKNAFASQVPTGPSLNSLMRLAHADFAGDLGYFAGRTNGPLAHLLHRNGYKVSTGFNLAFFGHKGPFVDSYVPSSERSARNSTLCALATDNPYKFFSFCALASLIEGPAPLQTWPDRVLDIVRTNAGTPDNRPRFTLHYIVNPIGHTSLDYRSSDRDALARYAELYRNGAERVAGIMERLKETVRSDPSPSLLIVMGDHGSFLSRTVPPGEDETFVVQDRHGIYAAVLVNSTGCTPQQLQHYSTSFTTPERILAGVLRCLARDPSRIDAAMKFDEAYDFDNFLYE
ncbi:MAG: LTA synthase family protein, partial [Alphaproteobacteria bacterium]|nr:LTA synthase family protein [Alphaproteobacteria bacterium]